MDNGGKKLTFIIPSGIFPKNISYANKLRMLLYPLETVKVGHQSPGTMKRAGEERGRKKVPSKKGQKILFLLPALLVILAISACSSKPTASILLRDPSSPIKVVQDTFAHEGKSDYFLRNDEGYSFRLIYLCENRVYNFVEEPKNNPVLVSLQPILDTPVEKRLQPDDRRRIWACLERKVREQQARVEEIKRQLTGERIRLEKEVSSTRVERDRMLAEIEKRKKIEAQRQRRMEEERRRAEEERVRKLEEEQQRKAEEERKIKAYRAGEKEDLPTPPPPAPPKPTEGGTFLVMKEAKVREEPKEASKILAESKKYDIFEVINSRRDEHGILWYQFILSERVISEKGKRYGWAPEERSFWIKHKLSVWVYPGDLARIHTVKPIKLNVEDVQFTGKKATVPQKNTLYEVTYEVNIEIPERILGWIDEKSGIRRDTKTREEMMKLLQDLARTLWPLRIQNEILAGNIGVGFTPEQVLLSWGKPDHINTTRTLVGVHEQWVYGESPFPNSYVYFENGSVKSWEFLKRSGK
jgi:hypothetical protein